MKNSAKTFGIAFIAVAIVSQAGCALLPPALKQKSSIPDTPKIDLEPWLGDKASIPLKPTTTLLSTIRSKEISQHHIALRILQEKFDNTNETFEAQLEDNSVALVRGNEVWYFIRPLELEAVYGLAFPLQANDRVLTLPIKRSVFQVAEPSEKFQYLQINPDGTSSAVAVEPALARIATLQKKSNSPNVTCFVLTRMAGSKMHRLVLPIEVQFEGLAKQEISSQISRILVNSGLYLQPGDLVEFSNPVLLSNRLGG